MNFLLLIEENVAMVQQGNDPYYHLLQTGEITPEQYVKLMDKFVEVLNTKQLRKDIDEVIQRVKALNQSRETSLAITKLQESVMWLGMNLKRLGELDPYPESRNPESQEIAPTADGLKF